MRHATNTFLHILTVLTVAICGLTSLQCWQTAIVYAQNTPQSTGNTQLTQHAPLTLTGVMLDSGSREALVGVRVRLLRSGGGDTALVAGGVTGAGGMFWLKSVPPGAYTLVAERLAYTPFRKPITVSSASADTVRLGIMLLQASAITTQEVEVSERAARVEVKGDTLEYNAKAFKTDKNAAAEDLIRKLPGVEVENGAVKAQGETVRRVLVDGKPFFGDDPTAVLKNLPAEIIDRIQISDQMSDQAQFTRFDDGDRTKTLNIVTRADKRNGQFGKLYGGYGSNTDRFESRYTAGGNVNFFNGDRRIALIGMGNNINQQNFSVQDILGVLGSGGGGQARVIAAGMGAGGMGAMMRAMGGGGGQMRMFGMGGGNRPAGAGSVGDFLVPQSDGITAAHALGVNYNDTWAKNLVVSGAYFVNLTDNSAQQSVNRQYVLSETFSQRTVQNTSSETHNMNHRLNARIEYTLDSSNSFIFTPRMTLQTNNRLNSALNTTLNSSTNMLLNSADNRNTAQNSGWTFDSELLWRHRFATEGRTLSANVRTNLSRNTGDATTAALNSFYSQIPTAAMMLGTEILRTDSVRQESPVLGSGITLGGNINYTEPLHDKGQMQATYNIAWTRSDADRRVYDFNSATNDFDRLNMLLTNTSANGYLTHRPGVGYRYAFDRGASLNVGVDYQVAVLSVDQTFPQAFAVQRSFGDVLPSLSLTMRPSMTSNFRVNYRTFTNAPSIRQLQNVLDNSDPLRLYVGNPELNQEYTHSLSANYGTFNITDATAFFVVASVNVTSAKIINASVIAAQDSVLNLITNGGANEGIRLGAGGQLTKPVNADGFWNANTFVTYSFPIEPVQGVRLNTSLTAGGVYTRNLSLINGATNIANNFVLTPSLNVSSNISENIDFSLSGRTAYNTVTNSLQQTLNSTFFTHTLSARGTWIIGDGWLVTADFIYIANVGLSGGFNQSIPLLSGGVGKRFWDGAGELKLSVFDALNQNTSITRNVTGSYIEDAQTNVLRRYALLTFTYNLRAFGS